MPENLCRTACAVSLKYNCSFSIPRLTPGQFSELFLKITVQIPNSSSRNAVQMTHNRSILGDQIPQPRGNLEGVIH